MEQSIGRGMYFRPATGLVFKRVKGVPVTMGNVKRDFTGRFYIAEHGQGSKTYGTALECARSLGVIRVRPDSDDVDTDATPVAEYVDAGSLRILEKEEKERKAQRDARAKAKATAEPTLEEKIATVEKMVPHMPEGAARTNMLKTLDALKKRQQEESAEKKSA